MFKKTVIAATLVGFASAGSASVLTATAVTPKSEQGILTSIGVVAGSFQVVNALVISSGSTIQTTYSKAPTNAAAIDAAVTNCGAGATITYAGATSAGTVLNYTVANTEGSSNLLANCETTFGANTAPVFLKADVQAAPITTAASWTVVGSGVDPATYPAAPGNSTGAIISMLGKDQFGLEVTAKASKTVDVEKSRKTYVGATQDAITLTHRNFAGGAILDGTTATSSVITITGNFAWADDHLTAAFDVGTRGVTPQTPIAVTGTGGYVIGDGTNGAPAPTASTLSLVSSNPSDGDTAIVTFTPLVEDLNNTAATTDDILAVALPDEGFAVSQVVTYKDEVTPVAGIGTQSTASASAGAWGLNGASVKVFSVPFGAEVESHSIFVANSGISTGAISASVVWNGNAPVTISLGDVQANANKYLNVIAALEGIGEKPAFGRADITFTVNSPAADITFTAGYTTAAGRANLFMVEQANIATLSSAAATSVDTTCDNLALVNAAVGGAADITAATLAGC